MGISEKLMIIQTQIKAPKNLYNSFGKYKYRNAESICEAAKPFLAEQKCTLLLEDSIEVIGGRVYVVATATIRDCESGKAESVRAYAREPEEKKGMDSSQVTGATSSYARKYALNGLFLLDDTKDPDTEEYQSVGKAKPEAKAEKKQEHQEVANEKIDGNKAKALIATIEKYGLHKESVESRYKCKIEDMTLPQWMSAMKAIEKQCGGK